MAWIESHQALASHRKTYALAVCIHNSAVVKTSDGDVSTCRLCGQKVLLPRFDSDSKGKLMKETVLERGYIGGVMTEVHPPNIDHRRKEEKMALKIEDLPAETLERAGAKSVKGTKVSKRRAKFLKDRLKDKEAITADYLALTIGEFYTKWRLNSRLWQILKAEWKVESKGRHVPHSNNNNTNTTGKQGGVKALSWDIRAVMTRQSFLKLPVEERRAFLTEQVETLREICPSMFVPEPDLVLGRLDAITNHLKCMDEYLSDMVPPAMSDDIKEEIFYSLIAAHSGDYRLAAKKVIEVMNALAGV